MEAMYLQHVLHFVGQTKKDKDRDARTNRLAKSVCVGCGSEIIPFDPTGGTAIRKPRQARVAKPSRTDPAQAGDSRND